MAMIRLKDETKQKVDQMASTMAKLARAGAPGVVTHRMAGQDMVPADYVIERAMSALSIEIEADLELYHVSKSEEVS